MVNTIYNINCIKHSTKFVYTNFVLNGKIDIHADDEYAFSSSCSIGNIKTAKWLLSLKKEYGKLEGAYAPSISPHANLKISRWCKINIHAVNEYAFRWSCK